MGFFLLVQGVGMGGSGATVVATAETICIESVSLNIAAAATSLNIAKADTTLGC